MEGEGANPGSRAAEQQVRGPGKGAQGVRVHIILRDIGEEHNFMRQGQKSNWT